MQTLTTCPYCGVGCGIEIEHGETDSLPVVLADKNHPANLGRICSKGSALGETLDERYTPKRLTYPMVNGQRATWDTAVDAVATRIAESVALHGSESVAFYLSGQLLTEDYYVANKLAKGFIGTANVDTNSRLCMSSAVSAYKRAFGSDTVPCSYEDLELAELIILIGSNTAWTHPVLFQRIQAARENNPNFRLVVVDPRKTVTAAEADLHLAIKPSSDNFLFQGLLHYLIEHDACDHEYIAQYTEGYDMVSQSVADMELSVVADVCEIDVKTLQTFYRWFAETDKTVSFYSQGVNQSASGTDKCNTIINCHLASAKIGVPGAGPFSVTGQPNAMGGREVGGLATMLAAHMDFSADEVDCVRRFWSAPNIVSKPGLKAVELFEAIADGKIKVLWIMATNPVVSLPDSSKVREALGKCETVIVSDITSTDTTHYADILLPVSGWSEKDGTVTNSERRISRQRAFQMAPGEAKPDWWVITQVARSLGYADAFPFQSPAEIFNEHVALSAFENHGKRDFDLGGIGHLTETMYNNLQPVQWPVTEVNPAGTKRLFSDGRFFTDSGKARFVPSHAKLAQSIDVVEDKYPFLLLSGRLRDQWHTMTRTGSAPRLCAHTDVAFVEVNPTDAATYQLADSSVVRVSNDFGSVALVVKISEAVRTGELFLPIHWSQMFSGEGVANMLFPSIVDPTSGQPELKATRVKVEPVYSNYWARVVTPVPIENKQRFSYWAVSQFERGYVYLLGGEEIPDWKLEMNSQGVFDLVEYKDPVKDRHSLVFSNRASVQAMVFQASCASELAGRTWMLEQIANNSSRSTVNALRGETGGIDSALCACFGTTRKRIELAMAEGCTSSGALSAKLGCGSKCGSCIPELKEITRMNVNAQE